MIKIIKKNILIISVFLIGLLSCKNSGGINSKYSTFEKETTERLDSLLRSALGQKVLAENKEILYCGENDSICVVKFDCVWERASGRVTKESAEYVYDARGLTNRDKDLIIDLSREQSIIEDAKDYIDEIEMDASPEGRKNLKGGWQSVMRYVVPLRMFKTNY